MLEPTGVEDDAKPDVAPAADEGALPAGSLPPLSPFDLASEPEDEGARSEEPNEPDEALEEQPAEPVVLEPLELDDGLAASAPVRSEVEPPPVPIAQGEAVESTAAAQDAIEPEAADVETPARETGAEFWVDTDTRSPEHGEPEEVPGAIEKIEREMITEEQVVEQAETVPPNRTPWRVLVIGGLVGVIAVIFWAYTNDVIRLEPRPQRAVAPVESNSVSVPGAAFDAVVGRALDRQDEESAGGSGDEPVTTGPAAQGESSPVTGGPEPAGPVTEGGPPATAGTSPRASGPENEPIEEARTVTSRAEDGRSGSAAPATQSDAKPAGRSYGVHVSSFRTRSMAAIDLARYEKIGYRGTIVTVQLPGKGEWRRVLLGPYPNYAEAQRVARAIREDGLAPEAMVRKIVP
jgi:hypothetical protein